MVDRLAALKNQAAASEVKIEINKSEKSERNEEVEELKSDVNDDMKSFMAKSEKVHRMLDILALHNTQMKEFAEKHLATTESMVEKEISQSMNQIIRENTKMQESIKKILDEMSEDIKKSIAENAKLQADSGEPPEIRMRQQIQQSLAVKFQEILKFTNEAHSSFKKAVQDKIKRQLRLTMPKATEEEIEQLAKDPDAGTKQLEAQIFRAPHQKVVTAVEDIKQKYHDILELERSVGQVHQLFLDLALLVHEQVQMLDNIEQNMKQAKGYLDKGVVHLEAAKQSYVSSRKKMCFLLLCVVIVLVIVLVMVFK